MAFTIDDGPLGLEAIWNIGNTLDINNAEVAPRIKLDRIGGIHSLPDLDDHREANYGQAGERTYITNNRGRTLTFEGRVQALTLQSMRRMSVDLRLAFSRTRQTEGDFKCWPHPLTGGPTWTFRARTLAFEMDDEFDRALTSVPSPYQRPFIASVRMGDPRYFVVGADVTTSGASGEHKIITNPGNAISEPKFFVNGPLSNVTLDFRKYAPTERLLRYDEVTLAAGQTLCLDFQARTFRRISDDEDYDYLRDFSASDWWDPQAAALNTGPNEVSVEGAAWSMSVTPASW